MDSCRQFPRGFCLLSRSAFAGHASGCDRSWLPHSHLLRRLHVGRGWIYRFFSYLNLFMFFMLTLVLANNYLVMFIGWEGVGLASYLLIGFFFLRDSAASAGKKAFIVNRVGDFGFLIALFLLIKHFGSLDF